MAGRNFKNFRNLASRLIQKSGRIVSIVREPTTTADPLRPWEGPEDSEQPEVLVSSVDAVFTMYSRSLEGQTAVQRGDKKCLISADDLPSGFEPDTSMKILDRTRTYSIIHADVVQPGEPNILWKLQVRA